jgi:hypothetical protein
LAEHGDLSLLADAVLGKLERKRFLVGIFDDALAIFGIAYNGAGLAWTAANCALRLSKLIEHG